MRLVVLTESSSAVPEGYDVRLGPLWFVTPADAVGETLGNGLEAVGGVVIPAARRPRSVRLRVPVRGDHREIDAAEVGRRLRRRARALLDNDAWKGSGLYFTWAADPDLDGWLAVGGGELSEKDPGITFGEFDLEFDGVFLLGRPGTHRPARRITIGDRRGGLVPRDSRRLLYSTDFADHPLLHEPVMLPGDSVDLVRSGNRPVVATTMGPLRDSRRLWRTCAAVHGETVSYAPDVDVLPDRDRYLALDDLGSVRVWDLTDAPAPYEPGTGTRERDSRPDLYLRWERVLGDALTPDRTLAIDNGISRLVWLGPGSATGGLAVEWWDAGEARYLPHGRLLHAIDVREISVVEVTPERAVLEWRAAHLALRVILQRGWPGPRIESFNDAGGPAGIEYSVLDGTSEWAPGYPLDSSLVRAVSIRERPAAGQMQFAVATADTHPAEPRVLGGLVRLQRDRVAVTQLGHSFYTDMPSLASLGLADVRAIPTLVRR